MMHMSLGMLSFRLLIRNNVMSHGLKARECYDKLPIPKKCAATIIVCETIPASNAT